MNNTILQILLIGFLMYASITVANMASDADYMEKLADLQDQLANTTASLASCEEEMFECRENGYSPYSK